MPQNMGTTDRTVRLVIGAAALMVAGLGVGFASAAGIVLAIVATIMLATSAAGFCPLYAPFHLATRRGRAARA